MTIILVCILIFAAILASGLVGLFVQHRLPEAQKSESARLIIGQISGVLSLLLSLVLGTRRHELRLSDDPENRTRCARGTSAGA